MDKKQIWKPGNMLYPVPVVMVSCGNKEGKKNEQIKDFGQEILHANRNEKAIYLLSIIGEIEGHECLPSTAKTTKYEHVLPKLAAIEDDSSVDGVLLILNTMGGDVGSGLRFGVRGKRG